MTPRDLSRRTVIKTVSSDFETVLIGSPFCLRLWPTAESRYDGFNAVHPSGRSCIDKIRAGFPQAHARRASRASSLSSHSRNMTETMCSRPPSFCQQIEFLVWLQRQTCVKSSRWLRGACTAVSAGVNVRTRTLPELYVSCVTDSVALEGGSLICGISETIPQFSYFLISTESAAIYLVTMGEKWTPATTVKQKNTVIHNSTELHTSRLCRNGRPVNPPLGVPDFIGSM